MSIQRRKVCLAVLVTVLFTMVPMAFGAGGDVGFGGGGSFYLDRTVSSPAGDATVGFKPGFHGTAWVGQNLNSTIGGEVRYLFEYNDMKLDAPGSGDYTFSGVSHAIHYNVLFHAAGTDSSARPFVAVGGGAKGFYGTGEERFDQPGQNIAILSRTSDWKPLIVFGAGVKFRVSDGLQLRVEVYDYFSQVPDKVIAPAPGVDFGGWFHNLVPSVGLSFTF